MEWEFLVLDWLQGVHSPCLDAGLKLISSLGNVGAVWILLAVILLLAVLIAFSRLALS